MSGNFEKRLVDMTFCQRSSRKMCVGRSGRNAMRLQNRGGRGMAVTNLGHVEGQWPKPSSSGWTPDLFISILSALAKVAMRTVIILQSIPRSRPWSRPGWCVRGLELEAWRRYTEVTIFLMNRETMRMG